MLTIYCRRGTKRATLLSYIYSRFSDNYLSNLAFVAVHYRKAQTFSRRPARARGTRGALLCDGPARPRAGAAAGRDLVLGWRRPRSPPLRPYRSSPPAPPGTPPRSAPVTASGLSADRGSRPLRRVTACAHSGVAAPPLPKLPCLSASRQAQLWARAAIDGLAPRHPMLGARARSTLAARPASASCEPASHPPRSADR